MTAAGTGLGNNRGPLAVSLLVRTLLPLLLVTSALAPPAPTAPPVATTGASGQATSSTDYTAVRQALAARRAELLGRWREAGTSAARAAILDEARAALSDTITTGLWPPWFGTDWGFYGTSQTPGEGEIACGYFVTTVLRDAGLGIERVRLAQQASEYIVRTLAPESRIWRFSNKGVGAVLARVEHEGPGLYVIGLDHHVGFLWHDGATIHFCHSSYLGEAEVLCEPASPSPAMVSGYHVVGELLNDRTVRAWLSGRRLVTFQPG